MVPFTCLPVTFLLFEVLIFFLVTIKRKCSSSHSLTPILLASQRKTVGKEPRFYISHS